MILQAAAARADPAVAGRQLWNYCVSMSRCCHDEMSLLDLLLVLTQLSGLVHPNFSACKVSAFLKEHCATASLWDGTKGSKHWHSQDVALQWIYQDVHSIDFPCTARTCKDGCPYRSRIKYLSRILYIQWNLYSMAVMVFQNRTTANAFYNNRN